MKHEEKIAKIYFEAQGFTDIIYEPHGNRTPDFLLNNEIAVEVRRLNQHFNYSGKNFPLEKLEFALISKIQELFDSFTFNGSTYLVSITFQRPLKPDKVLISRIKKILYKFLLSDRKEENLIINDNLSFRMTPFQSLDFDMMFHIGTLHDLDEGGFVVSNVNNNLKIIVEEKEEKINSFRSEYKKWWLVLIDYIGYGLSEQETMELKDSFSLIHSFDRIYFVSPHDKNNGSYIQF